MKKLLAGLGLTVLAAAGCADGTDENTNNDAANNHADNAASEEADQNAEDNNDPVNDEENTYENEQEDNMGELDEEPDMDVSSFPQLEADPEEQPRVVMETNMGDIHIMFFPEYAPLAVENFLTLAEEDYYDDILFHRIIENFMVQGGDPDGSGMGGESAFGSPFEDEFDASMAHFRGALSMANSGPDANSSQFFIVHAGPDAVSEDMFADSGFPEETVEQYLELGGTPHLDFNHTVFGHVYEGMDTVDELAAVETNNTDMPEEDVFIENIDIIEHWDPEAD
ncbi:peptidylprolyl isomerase [Alkalicoccus chagannorensis]|uniref:peptidylprolyl isomerase n=1 Tax=Alkalicoccus chagannorensis TaxID=427072 RepID=UPI00040BF24E|nr:peptidylprolyl isomerase [Alkalicoccus chagannorensis]